MMAATFAAQLLPKPHQGSDTTTPQAKGRGQQKVKKLGGTEKTPGGILFGRLSLVALTRSLTRLHSNCTHQESSQPPWTY